MRNLRQWDERWKIGAVLLVFWGLLSMQLHAQIGPPPNVVSQPTGRITTNRATAVFQVQVGASVTSISYQWKFKPDSDSEDNDIPNANGSFLSLLGNTTLTLTRTNLSAADSGSYRVRLRNGSGTVYSSNAVLKVISVPLQFDLAQPASNGFQVHLTGITASNYVIEASSNLVSWKTLSTNSAATGSVNYLDPAGTNFATRFYRAYIR